MCLSPERAHTGPLDTSGCRRRRRSLLVVLSGRLSMQTALGGAVGGVKQTIALNPMEHCASGNLQERSTGLGEN